MNLGHLGEHILREESKILSSGPHTANALHLDIEGIGEYLKLDIEDKRENNNQRGAWLGLEIIVEVAQEEKSWEKMRGKAEESKN